MKNFLFDLGSTQNVISDELFLEIRGSRRFLIICASKSLKCANNSKFNCLGNVILKVCIGNTVFKKGVYYGGAVAKGNDSVGYHHWR